MISTATGPGSLYLTGEEELTYEWYREAVYSRRGTVGQCTRDSNRDIARQCETAGRSPLKRTSANHTETPNRRRATRPARTGEAPVLHRHFCGEYSFTATGTRPTPDREP